MKTILDYVNENEGFLNEILARLMIVILSCLRKTRGNFFSFVL